MRDVMFIVGEGGGEGKIAALEVLRHCPFVLLIKVGWRQGRALGFEEGKVIGRGLSVK